MTDPTDLLITNNFKASKSKEHANFWKATHCSIGFFLLEISLNTVENIQSQASSDNGYEDLGFMVLGIGYASLAIGCLFSQRIIKRLGVNACLAIGSGLACLWIMAQIAPSVKAKYNRGEWYYSDWFIYSTNILSAVCSGFGNSLIWVADIKISLKIKGKYISDCATQSTKGFYFGYFQAIYMASLLFGNVLAAYVFHSFDLVIFYLIMLAFCIAGGVSFIFLKKPEVHHFQLVTAPNVTTFCVEVSNYFTFMTQRKMLYLLPTVAWTGISLTVYAGLLTPILTESVQGTDNNEKIMKAFLAMITFGVGEIAGGLISGQVIDRVGNLATSIFLSITLVAQSVIVVIYLMLNSYGVLAFVMTFAWGFQDGINIVSKNITF